MKITAIIAEYNPFHNGHLKQLRAAKRETGADALAVVMSGSFTQRGDICLQDRYTRAGWAITAGADLVIELPAVYALSTAKGFAEGALKTLSMLGEYTLCFGTEAEDLKTIGMAAEFMRSESHDMSTMLKGFLAEGNSVAKSRSMALERIRPDFANMVQSPNNILAVEYIKAAAAYGGKVAFHNVVRRPDNATKYASSTKIRKMLSEGEDASRFIPPFVELGVTTDPAKYGVVSAYALKTKTAAELQDFANISEGMENRISKADFSNLEEFLKLTTRRYTRSTIKRIAASATIGLTKGLLASARAEKPYCTVLACRPSKKKALFSLLAASDGYFFFKPSDCPDGHPVRPLIDLDERAARILELCR